MLSDGWCTCRKFVDMENATERVCCQSNCDTIKCKFDSKHDYWEFCLNKDVLEAAHLFDWTVVKNQESYRFIGY